MRKTIAALAAAVIGALLVPAGPATAGEPVRILLAGDSITQGYAGDYTWRYFLDHSLTDAGTDFDFVGTRTSTFKVAGDGSLDWHYDGDDAYADPAFDQDHMSYWGGSLDETGFLYESGEQLAATGPDVMVGAFGANDLLNVDAETMLSRYETWISGARSVDPDIDFVIAALPWTWRSPEVARFNDMLNSWASEQATDTSSVAVARMSEAYSQDDTRDGIHPNVAGYRKIARMMAQGLGELGIATAPIEDPQPADPTPVTQPEIPAPAIAVEVARPAATPAPAVTMEAPSRPARVRAHQKSARVVVTWRRAGGAERYEVRCGTTERVVTGAKTTLRGQSKRCKVRASNDAGVSRWVAVRVR